MKYIHPILKWEAIYNKETEHYYCKYITDGGEMIGLIKDDLIPLGFQPVEETKTDWIDEDTLSGYVKQTTDTFRNRNGHSFIRCDIKRLKLLLDKHQPKSDVCNLVPMDVESIISEIDDVVQLHDEVDAPNRVKNILSKYGTTPQKKFTNKQVQYYIDTVEDGLTKDGSELGANIIRGFLAYNGLLEE